MNVTKKKDFQIKGRFTGSQLSGRKNEFVYEIFYNNKQIFDKTFSSKRKADEYLSRCLRIAKELKRREEAK